MEPGVVRLVLSLKMFKANAYVKFAMRPQPDKKKHSETVTSEETTTEKRPLVLNLDGNFIIFYKIFLINLVMQFLH